MTGTQWKTTGGFVGSLNRSCCRTLITMERTIKADTALATSAVVDSVEQFSQKRETMSAKRPMVIVLSSLLLPLLLLPLETCSLFVVCLEAADEARKKKSHLEIELAFYARGVRYCKIMHCSWYFTSFLLV